MNRRDFLKQLSTLPLVSLLPGLIATHTFGGWFKPEGKEWDFKAMRGSADEADRFLNNLPLDGRMVYIWVCSEALSDERIETLYQQSRQWFEVVDI